MKKNQRLLLLKLLLKNKKHEQKFKVENDKPLIRNNNNSQFVSTCTSSNTSQSVSSTVSTETLSMVSSLGSSISSRQPPSSTPPGTPPHLPPSQVQTSCLNQVCLRIRNSNLEILNMKILNMNLWL